eukprot:1145356-Pelagomonas_calceolata.AAC.7
MDASHTIPFNCQGTARSLALLFWQVPAIETCTGSWHSMIQQHKRIGRKQYCSRLMPARTVAFKCCKSTLSLPLTNHATFFGDFCCEPIRMPQGVQPCAA